MPIMELYGRQHMIVGNACLAEVPEWKRGKDDMTDESQLDAAVARALQAQELLDNELLTGAFRVLEDNYASAWRSTAIDDVQGREKLFLAINIVGKVRDHLGAVVANGRLAQVELAELARTAERRKRFGIP